MHSQFFPQKSVPEGWQYCAWGKLSLSSMDTMEPSDEEKETSLTADWGVRIQIWGYQALGEATKLS